MDEDGSSLEDRDTTKKLPARAALGRWEGNLWREEGEYMDPLDYQLAERERQSARTAFDVGQVLRDATPSGPLPWKPGDCFIPFFAQGGTNYDVATGEDGRLIITGLKPVFYDPWGRARTLAK